MRFSLGTRTFEGTDERRPPKMGEWFLEDQNGQPQQALFNWVNSKRLILREVTPPKCGRCGEFGACGTHNVPDPLLPCVELKVREREVTVRVKDFVPNVWTETEAREVATQIVKALSKDNAGWIEWLDEIR